MLKLKKVVREDWTMLPFLMITSVGFVVAIVDFVFLQGFSFQVFAVVGFGFLLVGGYIRMNARLQLKRKAGFGSLVGTGILQTVKGHRLVKDGLYKHIRHPIYLGEILRNLGVVLIFSSAYGVLLILTASVFLLFRIRTEEKMLVALFGDEYRKYQKDTKKILPLIY
jgi:protein-S-isoprenylcysteine O-methyltransferase Ste14